jgi:hypothetical protein
MVAFYSVAQELAMGKRPKKRDYSDKTRIDMTSLTKWHIGSSALACLTKNFEDAVRAVGTSVQKIEAYLKSKLPRAPIPSD